MLLQVFLLLWNTNLWSTEVSLGLSLGLPGGGQPVIAFVSLLSNLISTAYEYMQYRAHFFAKYSVHKYLHVLQSH